MVATTPNANTAKDLQAGRCIIWHERAITLFITLTRIRQVWIIREHCGPGQSNPTGCPVSVAGAAFGDACLAHGPIQRFQCYIDRDIRARLAVEDREGKLGLDAGSARPFREGRSASVGGSSGPSPHVISGTSRSRSGSRGLTPPRASRSVPLPARTSSPLSRHTPPHSPHPPRPPPPTTL